MFLTPKLTFLLCTLFPLFEIVIHCVGSSLSLHCGVLVEASKKRKKKTIMKGEIKVKLCVWLCSPKKNKYLRLLALAFIIVAGRIPSSSQWN